jgi:protein-disulfide isomerase
LQAHFGGRLRYAFRNFPLAEMHQHAMHAAEAAESVREQAGADAYWAMHHAIFTHQADSASSLDDAHLAEYAAAAGADSKRVLADLASGTYEAYVHADFMSGVKSGVNGTPTFFINGARYEGDWNTLPAFVAALEKAVPSLAGQQA